MYGENVYGSATYGSAESSSSILLSLNDSVTASEQVYIVISVLFISVYDQISTSENVSNTIPFELNIFDAVTASENVNISVTYNVSAFDLISVSEYVSLAITPYYLQDVSELVTISESIVAFIPYVSVSSLELIIVSESVSLNRKIYGYSLGIPIGDMFEPAGFGDTEGTVQNRPRGDLYEINTEFGGVL